MTIEKISNPPYPTLSKELLRQRKANISAETILDLEKSNLIFVDPDSKSADFNNYFQSRSFYGNKKELEQLKDSIIANGILEPLLVCEDGSDGSYRVLEGNRRAYILNKILEENSSAKTSFGWSLSSVSVKVTENPQKIIDREYNNWLALNKDKNIAQDVKEKCKDFLSDQVYNVYNQEALHRNTQRKQWTWVEQMRSCKYRISHGESEDIVASSQNVTKKTLRYNINKYNQLERHPDVMEALNAQQITKSVATLFTNTNPKDKIRSNLLKEAIKNRWSPTKVNQKLTEHKIKIDTRIRDKAIKKVPTISFIDYRELTDFFLKNLLLLPSGDIETFLEKILDHEEGVSLSQEFKETFFKQISKAILSQQQNGENK
jgi:hypothetical protein